MSEHLSEREVRMEKLQRYSDLYGNPFPASTARNITVNQFIDRFDSITDDVVLAGRVRYWRAHGKLAFAHIEDASGKVQVVLSKEELPEVYEHLDLYDVGDIIEVTGTPFTTHKGEQSVLASGIRMLTKAIEPLPDKHHGLQDEELRMRKRYLDMIMRPELRELFMRKSIFWNAMRNFLVEEGFVEVETPVLESTPGGADAEPFSTHHNALDIDVYLRISMGELWQKRLMVGGFEKTFEIGRQFRNEGMSPEHLQDYTQMEFYWAFADYTQSMELVERMYKHVIMETYGTLQFSIRGEQIDLSRKWHEIDYATAVKEKFGVDITTASIDELRGVCQQYNIEIEEAEGKGRLIDTLWKQCRKDITGPAFLVNHPVEVSPLAKRQDANSQLVQRYQVIIAGSEIGNGYSELNDPIDQRSRFEEQAALREAGDAEAQMHDEDFVEALEVGMPPTTGFGVSERLFSFLEDKPIRECVMFPLMRPKPHVDSASEQTDAQTVEVTNRQDDETLSHFDAGITLEQAREYMFEHVADAQLRKHMLACEVQMRALAQECGAENPEAWAIAGLLHDVDYDLQAVKDAPELHGLKGAEMIKEQGVHPYIVQAVHEHNTHLGLTASTKLSQVLQCLEQLTGLVMAATYVRPDKSIHGVKVKSIKKKLKDKGFARGVDRSLIVRCEELTGIPLDTAIELTLTAMQGIAAELELE